MSEPIRKRQTALGLGQECLAEVLDTWREQPRTALALALEKAPAELAPDIVLAAALAEIDSLRQAVSDESTADAFFSAALALEHMGRELDVWHAARAQRWERRA